MDLLEQIKIRSLYLLEQRRRPCAASFGPAKAKEMKQE